MRCAITGLELSDPSDGIWDDGEWISWEWINDQIDKQEFKSQYEVEDIELVEIFERFVDVAADYKKATGRYLQVWGELGELYAQVGIGLNLHRPHAQGSDGKLGNDFVEVKTISPEKAKTTVTVSRGGNFSKLLVVKIDDDFNFESRLVDRSLLGRKKGKRGSASLSWSKISEENK